MIILDTNVVSELMRKEGNKTVQSWLDGIPTHQVYITAITKAEIEYGVMILPEGKKKKQIEKSASDVLALFEDRILSFNADSTHPFAAIKSGRKRQGHPISNFSGAVMGFGHRAV
jgi:toxin FitB